MTLHALTPIVQEKPRATQLRPRIAALILCGVLLTVLSAGCVSVQLGDVTDYYALPETARRARDLRYETSGRHVLTKGDSVELTAGNALMDVDVSFNSELPTTITLMEKVPRAALPIPLMVAADRIKVTHGGKTTELHPASAAGSEQSWDGLADVLRVDGLKARLVPENRTWVQPGDTVILRRMYQEKPAGIGGGSKPPQFHADEHHLRVDSNGDIYIPPLSSAGLGITVHEKRDELIGAIDRAAFKVRLWQPGTAYANLPSLDALANCLTVAQAAGPADPPAVCACFGIDARFSPSTQIFQNIRYQLEGELGFWTLADEENNRLTVPLRRGQPLLDAVRAAYRRLARGELIRPQVGRSKAYVTVVPDESWGTPRERQSFTFEYSAESINPLPHTVLLRGDTVLVSRERPRRPREFEFAHPSPKPKRASHASD